MARPRDYKAEYQRRITRGASLGRSKAESRGHRNPQPFYDKALEAGVKRLREGTSLEDAAKSLHVAPERLRTYIAAKDFIRKSGNRWVVGKDVRHRRMLLFTRAEERVVTLPNYNESSKAGAFMSAAGHFLETGDINLLEPFRGQHVTDDKKKRHPFETDPNVLYALGEPGGLSMEDVYTVIQ